MKFGGTSMGSAERIKEVANIVRAVPITLSPLVVVSAMTGVTNALLEAVDAAIKKKSFVPTRKILKTLSEKHCTTAKALVKNPDILAETESYIADEMSNLESFLEAISFIKELTPASHDKIIAIGEKFAAKLLAAHLSDQKGDGAYVNLEKIHSGEKLKIDQHFFDGLEKKISKKIHSCLQKKQIPVCTGFFGCIPGGIIEAVGRGYSDFCAAIVGSALKVKEIQIWTDVDGILSADPRVVKNAFVLNEVSFNEAAEMASFGAKVLHPQTIWPAVKRNIPVRIKNTMNPSSKGTLITRDGRLSNHLCKAITAKKGITVVSLISSQMPTKFGYLAKIFNVFDQHQIAIDIVATSEISVSLTVQENAKNLMTALADLKKLGRVSTLGNQAIVSAIGQEMGERIGSGSKILQSIASQGLNASVISRNALKINISCVIDEKRADDVVRTLHKDILE